MMINSYSFRITILFFALSGLDLLNALDRVEEDKQGMINWIYAQQIVPSFEGNCKNYDFLFPSCYILLITLTQGCLGQGGGVGKYFKHFKR